MNSMYQSNFGLSQQPAQQEHEYDQWFWESEEVRAAKREAKLMEKASKANQNNAMANAMNAMAQQVANTPTTPTPTETNSKGNTALKVVGGVLIAGLVIGIIATLVKKSKENAAADEALQAGAMA